jgi:hypothetical protein
MRSDVLESTVGRVIGYHDKGLWWFSSVSSDKFRNSSPLSCDSFIPDPFQFIHESFFHPILCNVDIEPKMKKNQAPIFIIIIIIIIIMIT